jgi:hypothetical protein
MTPVPGRIDNPVGNVGVIEYVGDPPPVLVGVRGEIKVEIIKLKGDPE